MNNKFTLPNDCKIILEYTGNVNSLKTLCVILSEAINRDSDNSLNIPYSNFKCISSRFQKNGNPYIQQMIHECMESQSIKYLICGYTCLERSVVINFNEAVNTFSGANTDRFFFVQLQEIFCLKTIESIKIYILIKRMTLYKNPINETSFLCWMGQHKNKKSIFRIVNHVISDIKTIGITFELHKYKNYWYFENIKTNFIDDDIGYIDLDDEEELDDI